MDLQVGCEKDITSNQLTIMKVDNIPMTNEDNMPTIFINTEEEVDLEKG